MAKNVKAIPEGYHTITAYLTVRHAGRAIEFYKNAFGAKELHRMPGPDNKIMHATLKIGDSMLFSNDEFPEWGGSLTPVVGWHGRLDASLCRECRSGV